MLYSELNCSPQIRQAVERMGFTEMTEVQEMAIPLMLAGHECDGKGPHRYRQDLCLWYSYH